MRTVYLIRSIDYPDRTYTGVASNLDERLKQHNSRRSPHTKKYSSWKLVVAVHFDDNRKANAFERCLKTGSGRAFAKKHFW